VRRGDAIPREFWRCRSWRARGFGRRLGAQRAHVVAGRWESTNKQQQQIEQVNRKMKPWLTSSRIRPVHFSLLASSPILDGE
jgi:hypothetical protein